MISSRFEYTAPKSLKEATRLLKDLGDEAKVLAGGHSLLPAMKLRLSSPAHLVDLRYLDELKRIETDGKFLTVGALCTHHQLEASKTVARAAPLLQQAAASIGDVQVRNRGTIGGSLVHADPAADYPAALLALEAEVTLTSAGPTRRMAMSDFLVDMFTTALQPGEIVTEIRIPKVKAGTAYLKLANDASGFAVVGAAALVRLRSGRFSEVRLALNGVAGAAYRVPALEKALEGTEIRGPQIKKACSNVTDSVFLMDDLHAGGEYRAAVAAVYAERAIRAATKAAQ